MKHRAAFLLAFVVLGGVGLVLLFALGNRRVRIVDYVQANGQPLAYASVPHMEQWDPQSKAVINSRKIVLSQLRSPAGNAALVEGENMIYCSDPFFQAYLSMVLASQIPAHTGSTFAFGSSVEVVAIEVTAGGEWGIKRSFHAPFVEMQH